MNTSFKSGIGQQFPRSTWNICRQKIINGFSLVEVLIAMLIMCFGLIGIAGLILTTMKSSDSANMQSQAAILAGAILDEMRANSQAAATHTYDNAIGTPVTSPSNCINVACTSSQLAVSDLANWKTKLATLPVGDGSITTLVVGGFTTATITVQWNDTRANKGLGLTATTSSFTLESVL